MKRIQIPLLTICAFIFSGLALQATPLTRKVAIALISEAEQVRQSEITIGPIHQVNRKVDGQTISTDGFCVTFISPVVTDGIRRRTVQYRTLFYDADWGWYLYAIETIRGGDQIDVVSEVQGRFELR